eukprot:1160041-Pelagomonas_calceolata.AAC.6
MLPSLQLQTYQRSQMSHRFAEAANKLDFITFPLRMPAYTAGYKWSAWGHTFTTLHKKMTWGQQAIWLTKPEKLLS